MSWQCFSSLVAGDSNGQNDSTNSIDKGVLTDVHTGDAIVDLFEDNRTPDAISDTGKDPGQDSGVADIVEDVIEDVAG